AAWGGSNIESWISSGGMRAIAGREAEADLLELYSRDANAALSAFATGWQAWWRQAGEGSPWERAEGDWAPAPAQLGDWKRWRDAGLEQHNGMVWYRRTVTLTAEQAAGAAHLELGGVDEVDLTWVNGRLIGSSFGWGDARAYAVPAGVLRAGENSIVVNVLSTWDAGGLTGPVDAMRIRFANGETASLGDGWRYRAADAAHGGGPAAPWHAVRGISTIYNGMIAPLGAYGLRGALWYQGESNAGAPQDYEALLGGLIADWRRQFGRDLAVFIAQLPNFGAPSAQPIESGWADLREAQRRVAEAD
ncbi:MAG TPA: sialate O-acetylesterase, partial [Terricaulis sp.]|nr:sialate O-acetylesterase [Terricaulis sp.]